MTMQCKTNIHQVTTVTHRTLETSLKVIITELEAILRKMVYAPQDDFFPIFHLFSLFQNPYVILPLMCNVLVQVRPDRHKEKIHHLENLGN